MCSRGRQPADARPRTPQSPAGATHSTALSPSFVGGPRARRRPRLCRPLRGLCGACAGPSAGSRPRLPVFRPLRGLCGTPQAPSTPCGARCPYAWGNYGCTDSGGRLASPRRGRAPAPLAGRVGEGCCSSAAGTHGSSTTYRQRTHPPRRPDPPAAFHHVGLLLMFQVGSAFRIHSRSIRNASRSLL